MVVLSYLLVGILGYLGFLQLAYPHGIIAENITALFPRDELFPLIIRTMILLQLATIYPLRLYVIRYIFYNLTLDDPLPSDIYLVAFRIVVISLTALVSIVFPNVGQLLAYMGAVCGLWFTYLSPVTLHMLNTKPYETELEHPLLPSGMPPASPPYSGQYTP
mmetsp:Transcript_10264/g.5287  ORF Transcript_10264/g.5287 Transcript_10264/m.5287 type:complete len:162 (-) Transcript_10264:227-712(-)